MPGGYGTQDTDWGTAGTTSPAGSYSAPSGGSGLPGGGGGSNVQEGSNALADAINAAIGAPPQISASQDLQDQANAAIIEENIRRGIGSYAPPPVTQMLPETGGKPEFGGYISAQQQLAASLMDAGAVTSGALGGQALWTKLPVGMAEEIIRKGGDPTLYENEYFSSFAPGTQAYSPTGIIEITGPGALYENGQLVEGEPAEYNIVNPWYSDPGDQGWDPWSDPWYGGWGDYGNMRIGSLADLARHTWFSESLSDVEKRKQERAEEGLGVATMADMERMYDKDFAAKASPLFDPEFSLGVYEDVDPLAAGMDLFRKARLETA